MMVKMCLFTAITAKRGTTFAKNASHRAKGIKSATNVRDLFARRIVKIKYRLIVIAVRRIAAMPVMRHIIRMIGLIVPIAVTASVTIATRRKALTQYKSATVVTRAAVVIVGFPCAKRKSQTRNAVDVSN
eukprot:scaffold2644_cov78-Skeletonema_marinoi.AAC.2